MPINRRAAAALVLAFLVLTGLVLAGGAAAQPAEEPAYASANQAYRIGMRAYRAGDAGAAVSALAFAAGEGVLGAQLKLAEMYEQGDGVETSRAKAFQLYRQVADAYAETSPRHPIAPHVAGAFVKLAGYYMAGVDELKIAPDPGSAVGLYRHAASYFGDPRAQVALARLYLAGKGVPKNGRLAVNWLANAAKKRHAPAQALLGELLWRGGPGVRRELAQGLALLELARRNATTDDAVWIGDLYRSAREEAGPEAHAKARALGREWAANQGDDYDIPAAPPAAGAADSAAPR